jgi:hypothetical protein
MGSRSHEDWIQVESWQLADNAGGGDLSADTGTSGPDDQVGLPAVQIGDSYTGSHILYQDLLLPYWATMDYILDPRADGISNGEYVLTSVSHWTTEESQLGLPNAGGGYDQPTLITIHTRTGALETGSTVAMETLTITHEGFWLI